MFSDFKDYSECEPAGLEMPTTKVGEEDLRNLGLGDKSSSFDVLKALARNGIKKRGIDKLQNKKEYYDRAKYELDIFEELGFSDYIILNWDIINFAKSSGIPVNEGRGSAAGSLVLYLLEVVDKDPIKYNLYFERFVSRSRAKKIIDKNTGKEYLDGSLAPDVDTDVSYDRRAEVISYIENKHKGKTAKILTFNTFSSKLCIKEATKFFDGASEEEAMAVADSIFKKHGVVSTINESLEESENFKDWAERHKFCLKNALKVEGLNKNTGVHPSGLAICSQPIDNVCPLQLNKDGDLVTGYEMNDVAELMVKFDILGLRTLTIADRTCKKIGIELSDIDSEDPFIYEQLQSFNHPVGLFQISAETNFRVTREVKPENLLELSDVVAIARPAALQFLDEYVKQKRNPKPLGLNKKLDQILLETKNVMLFQEQTMKACHEVFGMSLEDAELLRRAIGKKKIEEIPKWKDKIFNAAKEKNLSEKVAEYFWKVVEAGASYQFNASHSLCYSSFSAKTVYLKYKYPKEFFCSILEIADFEPDPLQVISDVAKEISDFGIRLLPPNLEKSSMDFTIEGDNIRYGLSSIKGVSEKTMDALKEFSSINPQNKYQVFSAAKQSGINIGVLSALIYAGTLGEDNRSKKVLEAQAFNLLTDREKRNIEPLGEEYNFDLLGCIADLVKTQRLGDDDKPIIKDRRFETFKKKFEPYKSLFYENRQHERLSIWWFEKSLLGYSYSYKLKDCYDEKYELLDLKEVNENKSSSWRAVVQVDEFFVKISQKGNRYMKLVVSDDFAKIQLMFCDSAKEKKLTDFLDYAKLEKGQIIVVKCNFDRGTNFVDSIKIMSEKVFMKTRELK